MGIGRSSRSSKPEGITQKAVNKLLDDPEAVVKLIRAVDDHDPRSKPKK